MFTGSGHQRRHGSPKNNPPPGKQIFYLIMKKYSNRKLPTQTGAKKRDLELLKYKQALQINTEMQDLAIEKLAYQYGLNTVEKDYLFDYLFNGQENITFSRYLKKLGVPFIQTKTSTKHAFKITISDGYCQYAYDLTLSEDRSIGDVASQLSEMGSISDGKLQNPK
jgi:hypothetical protein